MEDNREVKVIQKKYVNRNCRKKKSRERNNTRTRYKLQNVVKNVSSIRDIWEAKCVNYIGCILYFCCIKNKMVKYFHLRTVCFLLILEQSLHFCICIQKIHRITQSIQWGKIYKCHEKFNTKRYFVFKFSSSSTKYIQTVKLEDKVL